METDEDPSIKIEKIVPGGDGFARLPQGKAVFVSHAYPGETVSIQITQNKKDFCKATVVQLQEKSPYRISPFCKYFGQCGGCQWQDLRYDYQCQLKKDIFFEIFRRVKLLPDVQDVHFHPSSQIQETRHRMQLHYEHGQLGFLGRGSHHFIPIQDCPVATSPIRKFLQQPKSYPYAKRFCVFANTENICFIEDLDQNCQVQIAGKNFFFRPDLFFQNHLSLLDSFIKTALADYTGKTAVDMYAGVGLFSAFLQERFEKVFACEANAEVEPFFKINASQVKFFALTAEEFTKQKIVQPDFILMDPPRQGLSSEVIKYLLICAPQYLAYVSCDPVTQARDLQKLCEKYEIRESHIFDFYPHTSHIETILHLKLKNN